MRAVAIAALMALTVGCIQVSPRAMLRDAKRSVPLAAEGSTGLLPNLWSPEALPMPSAATSPTPAVTSDSVSVAGFPIPTAPVSSQPWNLSLQEAIRLGLQNSSVARVLSGSDVVANPVFSIDPAIAEARARAALAGFDPVLTGLLAADWINQPPSSFFGPGIPEPVRRNEAYFNLGVTKPWSSGGSSRVTYNPATAFLYVPNSTSTSLNPLNTSNVEFALQQPLLKGRGIDVNRAPIRIAQLRTEQSQWDFRLAVMVSVRSISEVYWDLQAAHAAVQAIDAMVPLMEQAAQLEEQRFQAQRSIRADVARTRAQLHSMRQQQVASRAAVVERELRLRNLLGISPTDQWYIIPVSTPLIAPVQFDLAGTVSQAIANRPDLIRQQVNIRIREVENLVARNQQLIQLDAMGLYRVNGVGETLGTAISQLSNWQYTDWQTGLTLTIPLGRRAAAANAAAAQLQLQREKLLLQQGIHATGHRIANLVQQIGFTYRQYAEAAQRARETEEWLRGAKLRYENPPPAGDDWLLAALNDYLLAVRSQADAVTEVNQQVARYNVLLTQLEEATGKLLDNLDVQVAEGATPAIQISPEMKQAVNDLKLDEVYSHVDAKFALPPVSPTLAPPQQSPNVTMPQLPPLDSKSSIKVPSYPSRGAEELPPPNLPAVETFRPDDLTPRIKAPVRP